MMGLGPYLGRQYAHDLVYDICREVVATGRPLVDLLAENEEITKHLDRAALAKLCDPANYLGEAGAMVDRVLAMRATWPPPRPSFNHSAAAALAAACSRTNFCRAK
jgi:3-carboxy-cis,cis-muconate cycloisomerase